MAAGRHRAPSAPRTWWERHDTAAVLAIDVAVAIGIAWKVLT